MMINKEKRETKKRPRAVAWKKTASPWPQAAHLTVFVRGREGRVLQHLRPKPPKKKMEEISFRSQYLVLAVIEAREQQQPPIHNFARRSVLLVYAINTVVECCSSLRRLLQPHPRSSSSCSIQERQAMAAMELEAPSPARYLVGAAIMMAGVVLPLAYMIFRSKHSSSTAAAAPSSSFSKQTTKGLI